MIPNNLPPNEPILSNKETGITFIIFKTSIEAIHEAVVTNLGENGMSATDLDRIKIPAGGGTVWAVPGLSGEEPSKELSGIVIVIQDVRMYWKVPLDQSDGNMPPDCYSPDGKTGTGLPGGDCSKCPFARFGSDPKNGGQACKVSRQIFLLRENNILPTIVCLPASSIKPAKQYFARLASSNLPCYSLITKIGLEKANNSQGIVYSRATFTAGERLTPEEVQAARQYAAMLKPLLNSVPATAVGKESHQAEGEVI